MNIDLLNKIKVGMKVNLLLWLFVFLSIQVSGQISLLKDINTSATASGGDPSEMVQLGSYFYFGASDGVVGAELWRSDGTLAGTTLFKDIWPGDGGGSPQGLMVMNGIIYFRASDGENGTELWRTDGTVAGTYMVLDINPGSGSSSPTLFTNCNGVLYFRASDGTNGSELWKSNGTSAGTIMVSDINTSAAGASSSPSGFTWVSGSTVYFQATDGTSGFELWQTDGTSA